MAAQFESQSILDAVGHGILIFASDGRLVQHNLMAGTILGTDLKRIKDEGWKLAAELFDTGVAIDMRVDEVRKKALESGRPVRFHIFRSGEYIPCWAAALTAEDGDIHTLLTLDVPDWEAVGSVIDRFRSELREAIDSTRGHISLISKTIQQQGDDAATAKIARRISGFTHLISIHMSRASRFMLMLERLEDIRTGKVREKVRADRKRLNLADYMEEFMESLDEIELLDPETEPHDYRSRIKFIPPENANVYVSRRYLTYTLQELLRNAIMYSLRGTPLEIKIIRKTLGIQVDVVDEGYGVREKEYDRVFAPFQRARQPQIISEFGYGLSLYLCKYEIETMGGRLWFDGHETVGTTFSLLLPAWQDDASSSDSSSSA